MATSSPRRRCGPASTCCRFASFLGYNPIRKLLGPSGVLRRLPARNVAELTGKQYFPRLISGPFHHGLIIVFSAAIAMSVAGALVSLLRGRQFYYDGPECAGPPPEAARQAAVTTAASPQNAIRPAGHQAQARRRAVPREDRPGVPGPRRSSPADAQP